MIADVYDAMISDRVYRPKIKRELVYEHLINESKKFSKEYLTLFIKNTVYLNLTLVISEVKKQLYNDSIKEELLIISE